MSIVKFVNGPNDSRQYLSDLYDYVTDPVKTENQTLVGAQGCSPNQVQKAIHACKKLHHKTHGKQGEHFVLSLTPDLSTTKDEVYMQVANEIADYFCNYIGFYGLHKDTKVRHLHFVLNSVDTRTGKKFSQSPSDLNRFKMYCNDVLAKHEFDVILASTNTFRDKADHSHERGFDYLEVQEPESFLPQDCGNIDIDGSLDLLEFGTNDTRGNYYLQPNYGAFYNQNEVFSMNNHFYNSFQYPELTPSTNTQNPPVSVLSASQYPAVPTTQNDLPTITVSTGPQYNISGPTLSCIDDVKALTAQAMANSNEQQLQSANFAWAMFKKVQENGYQANIHIDASPKFHLDLSDPVIDDSVFDVYEDCDYD